MSPVVEITRVFCEIVFWPVFQRTQTLLKEYKERDKSNVFRDKRFGEYNSSMSPEEKMMKRFALEQQVWKETGGGFLLYIAQGSQAQGEGWFYTFCLFLGTWKVQGIALDSCALSGKAKGEAASSAHVSWMDKSLNSTTWQQCAQEFSAELLPSAPLGGEQVAWAALLEWKLGPGLI